MSAEDRGASTAMRRRLALWAAAAAVLGATAAALASQVAFRAVSGKMAADALVSTARRAVATGAWGDVPWFPDAPPQAHRITVTPATPASEPQVPFASPTAAASTPTHAPDAPPSAVTPRPPAPAAPVTASAASVIQLVNQDRAAAGLAPLRESAALDRAAATHAAQDAAAGQMLHSGLLADVSAQGVSWSSIGECLGWWGGSPDAPAVNAMWMQSPEHRGIILGAYTTVGAAWARASNGAWYVSVVVIS